MAYKSYNPYSSDREPNRLRLLPFILLGGIALGMSLVGYDGYKRAHTKPKPEQWAYQGRPCKGTDCREAIAASTTTDQPFMSQCNGGQFVTDLRDCPEYKAAKGFGVSVTANPGGTLRYAFQPRKHKRIEAPLFTADTSGYITAGPGLVFSSGVTSYERSYMQIVGEDNELDFRQWDKAGSHYTIDASPDAFDCPAEFDETPDHHSRLTIRCTPKPGLFNPSGEEATIVDRRKPTTPQDITSLMEQIAPTKDQYICREAGECFPKCDSPLTPSITRACYQITFSGQRVLILPSNYAPGFTCPNEFESCGVVNSAIMISHELPRDCKMPADVDVCPTQQLDPKKSHD